MENMTIFDFIEDPEKTKREDETFQRKTDMYEKWLSLQERTLIKEGTSERATLNETLWANYCELYGQALHECERLPEDEYIWMNACKHEFWVLNKRGECQGTQINKCPYCGAELGKGKGNVYLYKAEAKYWLFYLYFDRPMYERGFQSPEERQKIKEVWG